MNKKFGFLVLIAAMLVLVLIGCGKDDEPKKAVVTFDTKTDTLIAAQVIEIGGKVKEPTEEFEYPSYTFLGWYYNGKKWDFEKDTVTENISLTAKWEKSLTLIEAEDKSGEMWVASCSLNATNLTIPSKFNGKAVTRIRNCAFAQRQLLESVKIPDSVKYIEGKSFFGCGKLESIVIPKSVTTIESGAFEKCPGLKYIYCEAEYIPEGWAKDFNLTGATVVFGYKG